MTAGPADRVQELAVERDQRAVRAGAGAEPLDRRVAVAGGEVLLAARQRAVHRPPGPAGERDRDVGVVARAVLGAEAAAHVVADHAHAVGGQLELLRDRVAHAPDELRRDVDLERLALPAADRLVGLERVVEDDLRAVLALDDHVRLGEARVDVAARVVPRLSSTNDSRRPPPPGRAAARAPPTRRRSARARRAPRAACRPRPPLRARRGSSAPPGARGSRRGRSRRAPRRRARAARGRPSRARAHTDCAGPPRAASPGAAGRRCSRLAARSLVAVLRAAPAGRRRRAGPAATGRARPPRRRPTARCSCPRLPSRSGSVAPRQHRLLDLSDTRRSGRGCRPSHGGRARASARARPRPARRRRRSGPGVQKPHCSASARTNASTSGWSRRPSIVVTSRPPTVWTSVMHESAGTPSSWTVHAPQWPSPQATFVPVRPRSLAQGLGQRLPDRRVDLVRARR